MAGFSYASSHVVRRRIEQCARFGHDVDNLGEALFRAERGKGIADFDLLSLFPALALTVHQPEAGGVGVWCVLFDVGYEDGIVG